MSGIHIDNGVNINPSWTNHIAVSINGVDWTPINKLGLHVQDRFINHNDASPLVTKGTNSFISLKTTEGYVLFFDVTRVKNQATWLGGTKADLRQAVSDITGWL